jgi:predicted membrane-bound dolichyl-phosphate-mannose-protein mannosyltransferase
MGISGIGTRLARTAVFTALCVMLSSAAHVLLSGRPLPLGAVVGVSACVFVLAYLLAGRERRFWGIAGLLLPLDDFVRELREEADALS